MGNAVRHKQHGMRPVGENEERGDAVLDHTGRGNWDARAFGLSDKRRKEKLLKFDLNNTLNDFG
jgi:hypothetical protein